jgi:crotonobetainyl-CoA:carnitine CoA-transferase CaiB-like acyl-CoA transferase
VALKRLISTVDVLLYSMRLQAMARLELAYDDVRALNPLIVYCGAVGYGQDGPYAARPSYDNLIQAAVGVPALQKRKSGPPENIATAIADRTVGIVTAMSVAAAMYRRSISGVGQEVQMPMSESFAQFILSDHLWGHTFQPPIDDWGYQKSMNPGQRPYRTSDGEHMRSTSSRTRTGSGTSSWPVDPSCHRIRDSRTSTLVCAILTPCSICSPRHSGRSPRRNG